MQISAYIDAFLASWLPTGAVSALAYAQTLYTLPVSLFGMSVSAAELPVMSGAIGAADEVASLLRTRLNSGLRQITFLVVPSAVGFLILGDVIVAAIYQSGQFKHADVTYVWGILAGSTVGLLASTLGRLYSSGYYALRDTRTPLRFAIIRVLLTTLLGYLAALPLPHLLGIEQRWGVAGLTISAGIASWVEFTLLQRGLRRRIGQVGVPPSHFWAKSGSRPCSAQSLSRVRCSSPSASMARFPSPLSSSPSTAFSSSVSPCSSNFPRPIPCSASFAAAPECANLSTRLCAILRYGSEL